MLDWNYPVEDEMIFFEFFGVLLIAAFVTYIFLMLAVVAYCLGNVVLLAGDMIKWLAQGGIRFVLLKVRRA